MSAVLAAAREHVKEIASKVLRNDPGLVSIDLKDQGLSDDEIEIVIKALHKNSVVSDLDFRYNKLGVACGSSLARLLSANRAIVRLRLHGNALSDAGVGNLCAGLSNVQLLDLGGNKLTSQVLEKLADALRHSAIQILDLSENAIDAQGAASLAGFLSSTRTLNSIDLGWNAIGAKGVEHISNALSANTSVRTVVLRVNDIGDAGAFKLCELVRRNRTITSLDVEANKISAEGQAALESARGESGIITELKMGKAAAVTTAVSAGTGGGGVSKGASIEVVANETGGEEETGVLGKALDCATCQARTMHMPLDPTGSVATKKNVLICSKCLSWFEDPALAATSAGLSAPEMTTMDKVMEMGDDESVSSGGFHDPLDPNLKEEQKVESSDESPRPSLLDKLLGSDSEDDEDDEDVVQELPREPGEVGYVDKDSESIDAEELAMLENIKNHRQMQKKHRLNKIKKATCSWCYEKCDHMRIERGGRFRRDIYMCQNCQQRTLPCRFCDDGFSRGSTGVMPNDQLCSRCTEYRASRA